MIDAVISTSLAAVALQWHANLKPVTNRTHGPLVGGLVINKPKWDSIPADVRAAIQEQITTNYEGDNKQVRKDDETAFRKLLQRGFTASNYTKEGEKEYQEVAKKAREAMVGRVYSRDLLDRVMQTARGGKLGERRSRTQLRLNVPGPLPVPDPEGTVQARSGSAATSDSGQGERSKGAFTESKAAESRPTPAPLLRSRS